MNPNCKKKQYLGCKADKTHTVNRYIWSYKENGIVFKEKESIIFNKTNQNHPRKKTICIGFNPAKCGKELDTTNKRLVKMLWDDYDGYTLLNLYPQVTPNAQTCDLSLAGNASSVKEIADTIEKESKTIILFWGCTAVVDEMIIEALKIRESKNQKDDKHFQTKYTKGKNRTGEELFTHPGSQNGTKLADFIFDKNVKTTNVIR